MWTIQLLGELAARRSPQEVARLRTQKAASLLAFLAFHVGPSTPPQPRGVLIEMLWPEREPEAGRHNLSNALSFLRHVLEPPGVPPGTVLLADRAAVRLNPAAVTTDVLQFESALRRAAREGLPEGERLALRLEAAEWYRGPLLPGFYEEWILPQATRLSRLFVELVGQVLSPLLAAGRLEDALELAERAVQADPLSEAATRHLMRVLAAMQQPSQALRAYRQLETRWRKELEEAPSESLQAYARELRAAPSSVLPAAGEAAPGPAQASAFAPPTLDVTGEREAGTRDVESTSERLRGGEFLLLTTTRFFGREAEIARLSAMLSTPRTRLVTLTGTGGTGKTRLALELAARLVEAPPGDAPASAVFVPLCDVVDPGRLFEVILRALGILPAPGRDPLDQVEAALASQPGTLLILDNYEQLVEEGAVLVRALLARTAVKLLVTSRQKLRLEGEHEFRLDPLPVPVVSGRCSVASEDQDPSDRDTEHWQLATNASVALFVDRAQAARSDFQLTKRNAAGVGQLCDRLEGLPLAIELAAARVSVLSPGRILEQVSADRLDFLATRRRDAASRQRTLRATLDWSYQLLPASSRQFLAELSVFRGGWTLEAAEAVASGQCSVVSDRSDADGASGAGIQTLTTDHRPLATDVLELLMQLRDSSLITAVDEEEGLRFQVLETVREYAAEQLERSGGQEDVQRRHATYFRELAEGSTALLYGPDQAARVRRLEREHDNFRAALGWARGAGEDQLRAELGCSLHRFWTLAGYAEEARLWLEDLGEKAETLPLPTRARLFHYLGLLHANRGEYEGAVDLIRQSLALYRELGDTARAARTMGILGQLVRGRDPSLARGYLEEGLILAREAGDEPILSRNLLLLAYSLFQGGEQVRARALLTEARALCRSRGDLHSLADVLVEEARQAEDGGDREHARSCLEENLALRRQIEDRSGLGFALYYLANLAMRDGRVADAARDYERALAAFRESQWDHTSAAAESMLRLIKARRRLGDHEETETLARQSLRILQDTQYKDWTHTGLFFLADAAARRRQPVRAARLLGILAALGIPLGEPEAEEAALLRAALIAELGAARFAQEERFGQTLPADEAMALALSD